MQQTKNQYLIILNFETSQIDCLDLCNQPKEEEMDLEEYVEAILDYNLSNCEYMVVKEKPKFNFLNF